MERLTEKPYFSPARKRRRRYGRMVLRVIDLHPTTCNLCGGPVIYTSNAAIYGKEYGSGKCYLCLDCGAYTGTHKPRPREALGLFADESMRKGKMACHAIFDKMWLGKPTKTRVQRVADQELERVREEIYRTFGLDTQG